MYDTLVSYDSLAFNNSSYLALAVYSQIGVTAKYNYIPAILRDNWLPVLRSADLPRL